MGDVCGSCYLWPSFWPIILDILGLAGGKAGAGHGRTHLDGLKIDVGY